MSGPAVKPKFDGKVHGVVVQARKYVFPFAISSSLIAGPAFTTLKRIVIAGS